LTHGYMHYDLNYLSYESEIICIVNLLYV